MAPSKALVVTIVVVSVVLLGCIITLIILAAKKSGKKGKVNVYYRGQGVRMASVKRKYNNDPTTWSVGSFSRVLPGSVNVVQGGTELLTSQDLRPFISRGDPVKVGPQIFVVSTDLRRAFTPSSLPLDTSTMWISAETGEQFAAPGKLVGPTSSNIIVYTCETSQFPYNRWSGPRGGAIGYWDKQGKWHPGNCPGSCPQWYSPLFLGPNGQQIDGPSPAVIAKVKNLSGTEKADNEDDLIFYDKDPDKDSFMLRPANVFSTNAPPMQPSPKPLQPPVQMNHMQQPMPYAPMSPMSPVSPMSPMSPMPPMPSMPSMPPPMMQAPMAPPMLQGPMPAPMLQPPMFPMQAPMAPPMAQFAPPPLLSPINPIPQLF